MFDEINFLNGKVSFNDFNLDQNIPLELQIGHLKEDLFQVDYSGEFLIDVGWYPEFDKNGSFVICVIKDFNWSEPILKKSCRDIKLLKQFMQESVNLINCLKGKQ